MIGCKLVLFNPKNGECTMDMLIQSQPDAITAVKLIQGDAWPVGVKGKLIVLVDENNIIKGLAF